jgi:hypothetical protein
MAENHEGEQELKCDGGHHEEVCRDQVVDSVSPTETDSMTEGRTLQDQELMAESENLCLQNGAGSETIAQRE